MFTIFFTIIFISEIILTSWIISLILQLDKKVCVLNEKILGSKITIQKGLLNLSLAVNRTSLTIVKFKSKIEEKKINYTLSILRSIIVFALFFTLNKQGKQALSTVDAIISIINLINKIRKRLI